MSGGQKQTTVTQGSSAPWEPAQQYLKDNLSAASDFYKSPQASQTYQGTTVIPFSQQSLGGMNYMEGVAQNARNPMQNPLTAYSGMMQTLDPIARGDFTNDTTFANNLGRAQQDAAQQVNLSMSGAGRYGSGAHTERLASTIGDMTNRAMLDRQQWASGALNQYGNSMPGAYQAALAPGQTMTGIGQQYENLAANYAQEQMDKFNAPRDLMKQNLAEQNAIYSGVGGLGGQQSGSSTVRTPSNMGQGLLGFGTSAAGYLGGGK